MIRRNSLSLLLSLCISVFATQIYSKDLILCALPVFSTDDLPWNWGRLWESQKVIVYIKEKFKAGGYELMHLPNNSSKIEEVDLFFNFDLPSTQHPNKCICILWEPPTTNAEQYDISKHREYKKFLTTLDNLVDNKKYFKFYYPQLDLSMIEPIPFKQKKLAVQISGNKHYNSPFELYSERRNVINFFERHHINDFDYYGIGWGGSRNYKGSVGRKQDTLKNYKFSFCYENSKNIEGYISEKIFDCFVAGCVPIYWGAENVTNFIPENCFIDRRKFADTKAVYKHIKKISKKKYKNYINNIRAFLASDAAYYFSLDYFAHTLAKHAIPDYTPEMLFDDAVAQRLKRLDAMRS